MANQDFTTSILLNESPEKVFNAVNNVRGWWSEEIEGSTTKLNDEFEYHYEDVHRCKMKLIEVIPNKKVVWYVVNNYFKFTNDKTEWKDTKISFDIVEKANKTELTMTHVGLVPAYECYEICRDSWTNYIQNSLYNLITSGKGKPNGKNKPQTENERKLTTDSD